MKVLPTPFSLQRGCDRAAIALAGACGIHCLITPVILIGFPILAGSFITGEAFHYWMLGATLPATTLAAFLGCREHKDRRVLILAATGLVVLFAAAFIGHELTGDGVERAMTVVGGSMLIWGHLRNFRLCRNVDSSCHRHG